jgi:cell wall-associated NlpC family hydrolase
MQINSGTPVLVRNRALMPVIASAPQPGMVNDSASFQSAQPAAPADPQAAPTTDVVAPSLPPTASLVSLTAEEQGFMAQGLLPANYADLKTVAQTEGPDASIALYRKGKQGPFSGNFGDIRHMLSNAREVASDAGLMKMFKDTKKGDIILIDYNNPKEFIAGATKGPFTHTMMCTQDGPPPEFIEAIGLTGRANDPSNNRVRRSAMCDLFGKNVSYRKISPADQLPEPQRTQAIDAAVKYALDHLGKPYDYTFGQTKVGRAFICSSLAYYAYVAGAKVAIPVVKTTERDTLISALASMMDALNPQDRLALMSQGANLINRKPAPTRQEWVKFVVEQVLPKCYTTASLCKTPKGQAQLEMAIAKFQSGQGLPRFEAANKRFAAASKAGKFNAPVTGFLRQQIARLQIGTGMFGDLFHAFDGTGMSRLQTLNAMRRLAWGALPYSEALSAFVLGSKAGSTKAFGRVLNTSEWFKNHRPFSWVCGWLPARGALRIDKEFISPTDLAWAKLPHSDYNVKPGTSLDQPL